MIAMIALIVMMTTALSFIAQLATGDAAHGGHIAPDDITPCNIDFHRAAFKV